MKKISLICILSALLSLSAQAQNTTFGVMAGVNFSNIYSNYPGYSANMRVGFHVGGGVNLGITNNFSINADLLYTLRGAQAKSETSEINNNTTVTDVTKETVDISYIEVPVLARYKLESGLYFNGGLSFAFLTGYKNEFTNTHTVVNSNGTNVSVSSETTRDHSQVNSTDLGLKLGLGYEFSSGLDLAANYTSGFSNIYLIPGWPYEYHHGVIGITVAYWFGK